MILKISCHGYGSYGSTIDPYFSAVRLFFRQGFIFAIAHVREVRFMEESLMKMGSCLTKRTHLMIL